MYIVIMSKDQSPLSNRLQGKVLQKVSKTIGDRLESGKLKEEELSDLCVLAYVTRSGSAGDKINVRIACVKLPHSGSYESLTKSIREEPNFNWVKEMLTTNAEVEKMLNNAAVSERLKQLLRNLRANLQDGGSTETPVS